MTVAVDAVLDTFAREVGAEGPVAVEGTRTRWGHGGPPADGVRLVRAPTGIVIYAPEEMTVTVRAGTTVADLHAALAEKGQRSGLPERGGTVGGALAVGENCEYVLGRGRIREALLQIRYVSAEGRVISGGGPTVKNVTGFDIPRTMVGSLGTLGLLAECILRTNPIPAVQRWLVADDADPFVVLDHVLKPSAILWDGTSTWVQLEGHGPAVDAETAKLAGIGTFNEAEGPPEFPTERWSLAPTELRCLSGADSPLDGVFVASIGVGTAWTVTPQPMPKPDPAITVITDRLKSHFDPTGRLNPGRIPGATR